MNIDWRFNSVRRFFREFAWAWESTRMCEWYEEAERVHESCGAHKGASEWRLRVRAALAMARYLVGLLVCDLVGHAWVGDGWAGPDSGGDGAYCERCGNSWHVTFY